MKTYSQQIRDILDGVQYPVDPQHESAFLAILLDEKKRHNRNVLWFSIALLSLLIAGYVVLSVLLNNEAKTQALDQSQMHTQTLDEPAAQKTGSRQGREEEQIQAQTQPDHIALQESANHREGKSDVAGEEQTGYTDDMNTNHPQTPRSSQGLMTHASTGQAGNEDQVSNVNTGVAAQSASNKGLANKQLNTENRKTSHSLPSDENLGIAANTSAQQLAETPAPRDEVNTSKSTSTPLVDVHSPQFAQQEMVFSNTPLSSDLGYLPSEGRKVKVECPVIPAGRIFPKHRIHYGVAGAWFPADQIFTKNHINTGYGFQIGGYASYRISPRIQIRADAGFAKIDGGFSYIKQSTSQQYGFSVLNQEHSLEVDRLYCGYAGAEMGLRRGKNIFFMGMLGQFLYGAKGDIQNLSFSLDAQAPTITASEDVWLTTTDMSTISVHGTVGVRSRLTRRVELGALLRIPISQTLRARQTTAYSYQVISHGITPQLMLSYQINQQ